MWSRYMFQPFMQQYDIHHWFVISDVFNFLLALDHHLPNLICKNSLLLKTEIQLKVNLMLNFKYD
jgi:hypothetical protein